MELKTFIIVKSLFLLLLIQGGGFITETLGCKTQHLLSNNMFVKQFIIILMIYFTLSFVDKKNIHPLENMKFTLLIWVLFIMFTKMEIRATLLCFVLLIVNYIIHIYVDHYNEDYEKNKNKIKTLNKYYDYVNYMIVACIFIGFITYFYMQYFDKHRKTFDIFKFLFGINKCKNM
jgi:hypothetical protein